MVVVGLQAIENVRTEIEVMRRVNHPNCISLHNVYESANHIYIVMELIRGGELLDRIINKEHYTELEAAKCFTQIMSAIQVLLLRLAISIYLCVEYVCKVAQLSILHRVCSVCVCVCVLCALRKCLGPQLDGKKADVICGMMFNLRYRCAGAISSTLALVS